MSIALAALIIAVCSLIWNIVSTLRSWRLSKPQIKLNVYTVHPVEGDPSLRVNVTNTSSSPVAITSIFIWAKWQGGGRSGRGFDYALANQDQADHIEGPPIPFTIDGYHSQNWSFSPESTRLSLIESIRGETREIVVEVKMATGRSVQEMIKIGDRFNSDEIAYLSRDL
jgi:hypothetical protein